MQIIEITVSYEATQSLSGYCNVRPGIRITARLDDGENHREVEEALLVEARATVHREIDEALVRDGQPPRYYTGPRYRVEYNSETRQVAILPDTEAAYRTLLTMGNWLSHFSIKPTRQMSADQVRAVAVRLADHLSDETETYTLVDCSDGGLSRLAIGHPTQTEARMDAYLSDGPDHDSDGDDDESEDKA
jgi:hypothetical protein